MASKSKAQFVIETVRRGDKAFSSMNADLGQLAKRAAVVGAAAAASLAAITARSLGAIDSLAKFSDRIGIATDKLSGLRLAGELTGVETNQLDLGLQRMTRRVAEAAKGMGEAQGAIKELGLDAEVLSKLPVDQQFAAIAERMKGVESQSDRVRLSFKLFDSEGVALVNTLRLGADGLEAVQKQAEQLGIAINRVDAAKVEAANDAMELAFKRIEGLGNAFAIELAPVITQIADAFTTAGGGAEELRETARKTVDAMLVGVGLVQDAWHGWRLIIGGVKTGLLVFGENALGVLADIDEFAKAAAAAIKDIFVFDTEEAKAKIEEIQAKLADPDMLRSQREALESQLDRLQAKIGGLADPPDAAGPSAFRLMQEDMGRAADEAERVWMELGSADRPSQVLAENMQQARLDAEALARSAAAGMVNEAATPEVVDLGIRISGNEAEDAAAKMREQLAKELEQVRQHTLTREEVEVEAMMRRQEILRSSYENGLIDKERYHELSIDIAQKAEAELTRIANEGESERTAFMMGAAAQRAASMLSEISSMTAATAQHNKTMFKLNKAAAIGNAIISTAQGITKALELPFPANLAAAAVVAAAGAVQIQQIKATQFGGGTTPSLAGTTGSVNGQPVPATPSPPPRDSGRDTARIEVHFHGNMYGAGGKEEFMDFVSSELKDRYGRDEVMFSSRSAQAQV